MISKDTFVKAMNEVRRAYDYQEGLNDYLSANGSDGFIYQPDCSEALVAVLEEAMDVPINNEDCGSDISYFCWEIDFGRKFKMGDVKVNGVDVDFSTAEKLYDYLTRKDDEDGNIG